MSDKHDEEIEIVEESETEALHEVPEDKPEQKPEGQVENGKPEVYVEPEEEIIKAGRPFVFTDPAELRIQIQSYFDSKDPHIITVMAETGLNAKGETMFSKREIMTGQRPYTAKGLARALGVSRQTLRNYRNEDHYNQTISAETRQDLISTIDDAFARIEEFAEEQLYTPYSNGAKFNLINNFDDWVDRKDITSGDEPIKGGLFGDDVLKVEIVNANDSNEPEASEGVDAS